MVDANIQGIICTDQILLNFRVEVLIRQLSGGARWAGSGTRWVWRTTSRSRSEGTSLEPELSGSRSPPEHIANRPKGYARCAG